MKKVKELLRRVKEAARARLEKAKAAILPVATAAVTALAMSPVAHAEDGDMSTVLSSVDTVVSLMGKVWSVMTSNPLLCVFLAVSLLMVGIRLFKKIKAAAR